MSSKVVVSDTNIWIDLYRSGLMDDVFLLDFEFVTTEFVMHELKQPKGDVLRDLGLRVEAMSGDQVIELYRLKSALGNSSLADVSCYFLAKDRGWTLLTGDGALRRSGQKSQLDVRGVLWLLDNLSVSDVVSKSTLSDGLKRMLESGARLPKEECAKRLRKWASSEE